MTKTRTIYTTRVQHEKKTIEKKHPLCMKRLIMPISQSEDLFRRRKYLGKRSGIKSDSVTVRFRVNSLLQWYRKISI